MNLEKIVYPVFLVPKPVFREGLSILHLNKDNDIEYLELNEEKYKMDDILKLLGMFIADGYCNKYRIEITCIKNRKQE